MHLLAIDQGTSSTKALVLTEDGDLLGEAAIEVHPRTLGDDGVVQDPQELLDSIILAGRAAAKQARVTIDAVGLANQGETVLAWDPRTGEPRGDALVWQDRRAASVTDLLRPSAARLEQLSGLPLDPYFTAPKLRWLQERAPEGSRVTGIDAWLNHQLCGSALSDVATASRSMLLDLDERRWSAEAVALFGLRPEDLAELVPCAGELGSTAAFGEELAVTALCVDQQAALIGEGCLRAGEAKCTYGTGAFLLVTTGALPVRSQSGLSTSVAWELGDDHAYCLDGQVYTAGSAIDWLVRLGIVSGPDELDDLARTADPSATALCVPSFAGLAAPQWEPRAKASIESMTLGTGRAEIVAGVLEGLAAQIALLVRAAEADLGEPLVVLRVDGGLTRSVVLMQLQADLLQLPVELYPSPHATALGIATLAAAGLRGTSALAPPAVTGAVTYLPSISADEAQARLDRFSRAADRVATEAVVPR